jgi:hypothetical protein
MRMNIIIMVTIINCGIDNVKKKKKNLFVVRINHDVAPIACVAALDGEVRLISLNR